MLQTPFYDTLDGLRPGAYLSVLENFLIFMTTFGFGVNLSVVTLFGDLYREDFDRRELISMNGEKRECIQV